MANNFGQITEPLSTNFDEKAKHKHHHQSHNHHHHYKITTNIQLNRPYELAQTKCIARCNCKWRSGKMWVECPDANLHHIPKGLDSGTQVLYLSGNPINKLESRAFERVELTNIQRLYLVNCQLNDINIDAFQQLTNLIELDLAHNELINLPTNSLINCPILRKLSLSNNHLKIITNSAFINLIHLQTIDFSVNQIETIEENAFYGLKNLKQLYLHDNRLRYIDGQIMKSLPAVYELTLHHNQWQCDCSLRTFREWMIEHRIPLSYSPNCTLPERLLGKNWNQLELDEFACQPIVISIDTEVVVYEGENASIGCVMEAIPNVQIEWEWRGRTIRNMSLMTFGRQMYLIRESYSSTGIMMSLLPVGNGNNSQLDLITDDDDDNDNNDINDQQNQQSKESNENSLLYSSYSSNKHQRKLSGNHHHHHESIMIPEEYTTIVNQHHHRVHRSNLNSIVEDPLLTFSSSSPSPSSSLSSKTSITSETTYKRTSTLYIMNALEKDSGSYVCTGYNKAGTVSANVTLTVLRRLEVTAAAYSGQEVAGIVIGTLFIFLLILIAIFSVVLRSRKFLHFRSPTNNNNNDHQSNHNGGGGSSVDNQTILGSTTITSNNSYHNGGTNGIIPNRHLQTTTTIPNGTLKRYSNNNHNENSQNHILPSTTTASNKNLESNNNNESMKNNLIVSMNPANSDSSLKKSSFIHQYVVISDNNNQINNDDNNNKMNIISNQLAEQIEMCDYSLINSIETNDTTMKMIDQKCSTIDPSMEARVVDNNFNQKFINNNNQFVNQQQQQLPMSMSIDMKTLTQSSGIRNGLFNNHNTTNVKFPIQDSSFLRNGNKNPVIFSQQHYDDSIISNKNINTNLIFKTKSGTMNKIRSTNPYNNNTFDGHLNSSHIINNNISANNNIYPYVNDNANNHHTMNFFESSSITDMPSNGSQLLMGKTYLYGQQPYRSTDHHFSYDVKNNEQILMNRCIDSIHPYNESILPNMINQNNNCSLYDQQQQQQRHLAASVAVVEELQTKFATRVSANDSIACQMKRNNSIDSSSSPSQTTMATSSSSTVSSSTGQIVRFANTPIVYNYSSISNQSTNNNNNNNNNKQASPLNRIKNNGLNPSLMARDSPDEGLGEETE
uniref:GATA zinc finger domain-containing protein 14-like n=1 Tax=Dermatophagoides pteronyssinus TaxID=6956 RepID=A0A6P6YK42_DERPT|nr:GATA zinc finger domain-containing protein 14-like [Dermatophagoides pteronyssinus]